MRNLDEILYYCYRYFEFEIKRAYLLEMLTQRPQNRTRLNTMAIAIEYIWRGDY